MLPKKVNGNSVMICSSCHYTDTGKPKKIVDKGNKEKSEVNLEIVEKDNDSHLPTSDVKCSKCGNKKAYYWLVQTRAGDEPETKFFKCTKCKHVWRDYS